MDWFEAKLKRTSKNAVAASARLIFLLGLFLSGCSAVKFAVSTHLEPENHPPVTVDQNFNGPDDVDLNLKLTASDEDSDDLTFVLVSHPLHGTLSGTFPNFVYRSTLPSAASD